MLIDKQFASSLRLARSRLPLMKRTYKLVCETMKNSNFENKLKLISFDTEEIDNNNKFKISRIYWGDKIINDRLINASL